MATNTSMLHVRVDENIKAQAQDALASTGLTMADAVRILLHRVVADQALPLELKVPNPATRTAMLEARAIMAARQSRFASANDLFADLEKNSDR